MKKIRFRVKRHELPSFHMWRDAAAERNVSMINKEGKLVLCCLIT